MCCCSRVFSSQASIFTPMSGKSFLSYCFKMNQPHHSLVPLQAWRSKHTQHQQKTQGWRWWWIWGTLGSEWESRGRTDVLCWGRDDFTFSQQAAFEARTNRRGMFSLCFSVTLHSPTCFLLLPSPCQSFLQLGQQVTACGIWVFWSLHIPSWLQVNATPVSYFP